MIKNNKIKFCTVFFVGVLNACGGGSGSPSITSDTLKTQQTQENLVDLIDELNQETKPPIQPSTYRDWQQGFVLSSPDTRVTDVAVEMNDNGDVYLIWKEGNAIVLADFRADLPANEQSASFINKTEISDSQSRSDIREFFLTSSALKVVFKEDEQLYLTTYLFDTDTWHKQLINSNNGYSKIFIHNDELYVVYSKRSDLGTSIVYDLYISPFVNNYDDIGKPWLSKSNRPLSAISVLSRGNDIDISYTLPGDRTILATATLNASLDVINNYTLDHSYSTIQFLNSTEFKGDKIIYIAGTDNDYESRFDLLSQVSSDRDILKSGHNERGYENASFAEYEGNLAIAINERDYFYGNLKMLSYTGDSFIEYGEFYLNGGENAHMINGQDGKLYLEYNSNHLNYSEFTTDKDWSRSVRAHCDGRGYSGCYNNGQKHEFDVKGKYGVTAFIKYAYERPLIVSLSFEQ